MKLAAIYNVFDGVELLKGSMNCLKSDVYLFIIVYQDVSNFGEKYDPLPDMDLAGFNYTLVKFTPQQNAGQTNEIKKRNLGIEVAKAYKCTHFIQMDCDEYYENFSQAKQWYTDLGSNGSVCKILTYFKEPTLRLETHDGYYVPFIHKLNDHTLTGNRTYPFYCDRTRQINEPDVIELPVFMHHFSWVRKNIERKCRNSSANRNIERGTILKDYNNPEVKSGFYVKDFEKKLIEVQNIFNINIK